jgi:hypothetical protein
MMTIRRAYDANRLQDEILKYGLATLEQFREAQLETERMRRAGVLRRKTTWLKKRQGEKPWDTMARLTQKRLCETERQVWRDIEHGRSEAAAEPARSTPCEPEAEPNAKEPVEDARDAAARTERELARQASDWLTRICNTGSTKPSGPMGPIVSYERH